MPCTLVADQEQALVIECSGREVVVRHGHNGAVAVSNHYCALIPSQPQHSSSYKTRERLAVLEGWLTEVRHRLDVQGCIARLHTPPIRRNGPPDNWTISSAVYEPEVLKAHLAHGLLPATRGLFVEVSLPEVLEGPDGLHCSPYGARMNA